MEHDLVTGCSAAIYTLSRCELGPIAGVGTHTGTVGTVSVALTHIHTHTHTDVGRESAGAVMKGARLLQPRTPKQTSSPSTVHAGTEGGGLGKMGRGIGEVVRL